MLSSVLHSKRAVQVNVAIMRAFIKLREMLATNRELSQKFDELEAHINDHDEQIATIIDAIRQLMAPADEGPKREIGFHMKEQGPPYRVSKKAANPNSKSPGPRKG